MQITFKSLNIIMVICTSYILLFSLYCLYLLVSYGLFSKITLSHPILVAILLSNFTGIITYLSLSKRNQFVVLYALLFNILSIVIAEIVKLYLIEYFDVSKGCDQLVKNNPIFELFIDKTLDEYFN